MIRPFAIISSIMNLLIFVLYVRRKFSLNKSLKHSWKIGDCEIDEIDTYILGTHLLMSDREQIECWQVRHIPLLNKLWWISSLPWCTTSSVGAHLHKNIVMSFVWQAWMETKRSGISMYLCARLSVCACMSDARFYSSELYSVIKSAHQQRQSM